jgi:hypothetical protein
MVNDLYSSFNVSFMNETYMDTIVKMKNATFENSYDTLKNYMMIDEKYKTSNEKLQKLREKYYIYYLYNKNTKLDKLLVKIQAKEKEIKEYQEMNLVNLDKFDNTVEDFKAFYEKDEKLNENYEKIKTTIMKYREKLKKSNFQEDIQSKINKNLLSIDQSFYKIYKFQETCGDFRRCKELDRYRTKTAILRAAIDCKIKNTKSEEDFSKFLKDSEVVSARIDTVLEYSRINWQTIESIREKTTKIFEQATSFDFDPEQNAIRECLKDIPNKANDTVIQDKMKTRFNLTDEVLLEYWTISLPN